MSHKKNLQCSSKKSTVIKQEANKKLFDEMCVYLKKRWCVEGVERRKLIRETATKFNVYREFVCSVLQTMIITKH